MGLFAMLVGTVRSINSNNLLRQCGRVSTIHEHITAVRLEGVAGHVDNWHKARCRGGTGQIATRAELVLQIAQRS